MVQWNKKYPAARTNNCLGKVEFSVHWYDLFPGVFLQLSSVPTACRWFCCFILHHKYTTEKCMHWIKHQVFNKRASVANDVASAAWSPLCTPSTAVASTLNIVASVWEMERGQFTAMCDCFLPVTVGRITPILNRERGGERADSLATLSSIYTLFSSFFLSPASCRISVAL